MLDGGFLQHLVSATFVVVTSAEVTAQEFSHKSDVSAIVEALVEANIDFDLRHEHSAAQHPAEKMLTTITVAG